MQQPIINQILIDYLETMYPDKAPELSQSDREVWFARGAVDVVRHLKRVMEDQQDNILDIR